MSKLLEEAIAKARELPDRDQDIAAEALLSVVYKDEPRYRLTPQQIDEVKQIQRDVREGRMSFASHEQMQSLWKKHGL